MEIIRSKIFTQFPELVFGMSTKSPSTGKIFEYNMSYRVGDSPENVDVHRQTFFSALGIDKEHIAFPKQEHTNTVKVISQIENPEMTDGLITAISGLYLGISIADCTPVTLYDPVEKVVAAVHAGWRGTVKKIVEQALFQMRNTFQSRAEDICVYIGPSAGGCCYEVGEEVANQFPKSCSTLQANGKFLLDVKKANVEQLLENGVQKEHIEIHSDCTICNTKYHSYRRDGKQSGRMLAIIGVRE